MIPTNASTGAENGKVVEQHLILKIANTTENQRMTTTITTMMRIVTISLHHPCPLVYRHSIGSSYHTSLMQLPNVVLLGRRFINSFDLGSSTLVLVDYELYDIRMKFSHYSQYWNRKIVGSCNQDANNNGEEIIIRPLTLQHAPLVNEKWEYQSDTSLAMIE